MTQLDGAAPESDRGRRAAFGPEIALWTVIAIWSSTWIAIKDAFDYVSPLAYTLGRFVLITVLAFAVLFFQRVRDGRTPLTIRRADLPRFLFVSLVGYTCYQLCSVLGLDRSSVFTLSLLVATMPLFTMLILAVRREPTPPYGWLGLGIAVVGVVVFLARERSGDDTVLGALLSLGAAISFAIYGIANRPLAAAYPPATSTAYAILIGTVPFVAICGPAFVDQDWSGIPLRVWLGFAYVIVFPVYVAYQLWNYAIAHRGAATASSYALMVPVASGVLSAIVFDEGFGPLKLLGGALVLAGLALLRVKRPAS